MQTLPRTRTGLQKHNLSRMPPVTSGYRWKSHQQNQNLKTTLSHSRVWSQCIRKQRGFIYCVAVIAARTVHLLTGFSKNWTSFFVVSRSLVIKSTFLQVYLVILNILQMVLRKNLRNNCSLIVKACLYFHFISIYQKLPVLISGFIREWNVEETHSIISQCVFGHWS